MSALKDSKKPPRSGLSRRHSSRPAKGDKPRVKPRKSASGLDAGKCRVQVPATTANLGPGYDCLGVALSLYNITTVARTANGESSSGPTPMVEEAAEAFFAAAGVQPFSFHHHISGDVPQSRGLGSSVTVRLGLLLGLDALSGTEMEPDEIFAICAGLEGHPDNAAPAMFGGFTIASKEGGIRFPVARKLQFVLLIPGFEVRTPEARKALPSVIPHADAARTVGAACRVTAAFASGEYEMLQGAFDDALHQPHRAKLIPNMREIIAAGESEGALGGFLSGSGSTIACVTLRNSERIGRAMKQAAGLGAVTMVTHADNKGAMVL